MDKKIKIILIFLVVISVVVVLFSFFNNQKKGDIIVDKETQETKISFISKEDEQDLNNFVKNFVLLYNSYTSDDYSNLLALGDYQTINVQKQTLKFIEEYKESKVVGVRKSIKPDTYKAVFNQVFLPTEYFDAIVEFVHLETPIENYYFSPREEDKLRIMEILRSMRLKVVRYNNSFLVDNIEFLK